jgi:phosphoketolase
MARVRLRHRRTRIGVGAGATPVRVGGYRAVLKTSYDTTELPTHVGELLEVLAEDNASGWLWCRSGGGRDGWVPINTLEAGP